MPIRDLHTLYQNLYVQYGQRFPNFLYLLDIVITLPMSTAVCERGFSTMKRVKSDWRANLTTEMLRTLLMIAIEGPHYDQYQPMAAFNLWLLGGERRRRFAWGDVSDSE